MGTTTHPVLCCIVSCFRLGSETVKTGPQLSPPNLQYQHGGPAGPVQQFLQYLLQLASVVNEDFHGVNEVRDDMEQVGSCSQCYYNQYLKGV